MSKAKYIVAINLFGHYQPLVNRAISIAKVFDHELEVACIVDFAQDLSSEVVSFQQAFERQAKEYLNRQCQIFKEDYPQLSEKLHIIKLHALKNPVDYLSQFIHEHNISTLIIGAHDYHSFELLYDSLPADILYELPCNILSLQQTKSSPQYNKILVATDLKGDNSKIGALSHDIARHYNAEVSVVVVHDFIAELINIVDFSAEPKDDKSKLISHIHDWMNKYDFHGQVHFQKGRAASQIMQTAKQFNYDLIVLARHHKGFFNTLLTGSTTRAVLNHASTDVMIQKL
ncbi:MAG: universal stress protein [Francisellaceae bacterium]